MRTEAEVSGVADTALWVAALRAVESKRSAALFSDPLAEMLAGKRGPMIARSLNLSSMEPWGFVIRTSAIDRLIGEALHAGVDTVINLGAGLDSRPYRLDLPAGLRWIEVDLPELIDAKNSQLFNHVPKCNVERVGLDLRNLEERSRLFARIGASSASTLLIAEGVIPYLSNGAVGGLAEELHAVPAFQRWILDFDNAGKRAMPRKWAKKLSAAPFLFQVNDWFEFFGNLGWRPQVVITTLDESVRVARPLPFDFPRGLVMRALPRELRRRILSVTGAVMLERETPRPQSGAARG